MLTLGPFLAATFLMLCMAAMVIALGLVLSPYEFWVLVPLTVLEILMMNAYRHS